MLITTRKRMKEGLEIVGWPEPYDLEKYSIEHYTYRIRVTHEDASIFSTSKLYVAILKAFYTALDDISCTDTEGDLLHGVTIIGISESDFFKIMEQIDKAILDAPDITYLSEVRFVDNSKATKYTKD